MDQFITMSQQELKKYDIIKKTINNELNGTQAAKLLNLSTRQVRRLKGQVKEKGPTGLVHGLRGRRGNRGIPNKEKQKIISLLNRHYADFGPTLAAEKLLERHKIQRDEGTIRAIMIEEGLWQPRQKKKDKHRSWRQRRASYGEMIQYDGSYEHWFEDRGPYCCLLASVDDATGRVWAQFDEHEGIIPTFNFWKGYIKRFGKPFSVYCDKFSTYSMNHRLAKENPDTLTQFERAMEKDLMIEVIRAHSAQAKGRVEKLFQTLQDRLIKELRLRNISSVAEANRFLEAEYLPFFNVKFMVEPRSDSNLHKRLNQKERQSLDAIFSRQDERVVRNDFTISHKKHYYQLLKDQPVTIRKQDRITVEERLDGTIKFRLRGKYLNYKLLPERPRKMNKRSDWVIAKTVPKPAPDHPWRKAAEIEYLKKLTKVSR